MTLISEVCTRRLVVVADRSFRHAMEDARIALESVAAGLSHLSDMMAGTAPEHAGAEKEGLPAVSRGELTRAPWAPAPAGGLPLMAGAPESGVVHAADR